MVFSITNEADYSDTVAALRLKLSEEYARISAWISGIVQPVGFHIVIGRIAWLNKTYYWQLLHNE